MFDMPTFSWLTIMLFKEPDIILYFLYSYSGIKAIKLKENKYLVLASKKLWTRIKQFMLNLSVFEIIDIPKFIFTDKKYVFNRYKK